MERVSFGIGDRVWVRSINTTAIILSVVGNQYRIWRADGKHDLVMGKGLEKYEPQHTQESSQETVQA